MVWVCVVSVVRMLSAISGKERSRPVMQTACPLAFHDTHVVAELGAIGHFSVCRLASRSLKQENGRLFGASEHLFQRDF